MSRYFTPGQEPRAYVSPTHTEFDHPAWVGRKLVDAGGVQVGGWSHVSANGEETSGSFGPIDGPQIQLQFNSGALWVENSTKAAKALQALMIRDSAMKLLAPSRRQLETNLRINAEGYFRPWVESYIVGDGENRLYTHGTTEESDSAFRKARRRIEDRLRKELSFLFAALRGEFWAFPRPVAWYETETPSPVVVECGPAPATPHCESGGGFVVFCIEGYGHDCKRTIEVDYRLAGAKLPGGAIVLAAASKDGVVVVIEDHYEVPPSIVDDVVVHARAVACVHGNALTEEEISKIYSEADKRIKDPGVRKTGAWKGAGSNI